MTFQHSVLIGCTALVLTLGMAATPAAADTQTAHEASKTMRHRPVMLPHHRLSRMPPHHGHMTHRGRIMRHRHAM